MKWSIYGAWAVLLVGSMSGCASGAAGPQPSVDVVCTEPRPTVCTRDYRPMCAVHGDGSESTAANGCEACADPSVLGYRNGACE